MQILGSDQVVAGDVPATFQKALQLPLDRMKQYATLIEKVAHLFPAVSLTSVTAVCVTAKTFTKVALQKCFELMSCYSLPFDKCEPYIP